MKSLLILVFVSFIFLLVGVSYTKMKKENKTMDSHENNLMTATFAGGCFWCMEAPFEQIPGVSKVLSGYTGGSRANPTYEQVSTGATGHVEAIQVFYDPTKVSYEKLLEVFWKNIDPTDDEGQFVDKGTQYKTAIFYHNEEQKTLAEVSKQKLAASGKYSKPIVTPIKEAKAFYPAEDYHQAYYKTHPFQYRFYKMNSGREQFIEKIWGKENQEIVKVKQEDLKKKLTPLQYKVTQEAGTEAPFQNEYWDNHREGIYVDVVTGEALFSSKDKFDSGSGWPSFSKPLSNASIVENKDVSYGMTRTEVVSKKGNSHLGHVFPDGPGPEGNRYCINSASLRFIAKEDLAKEGYGEYLKLFE